MIKMTLNTVFITLILLAIQAPAQAESTKDAFIGINKKMLKKDYSRLVMLPVVAASDIGMPGALKQMISDEVVKKFAKSKFQLTPSTEVHAIRNQLVELYPDGEQDSNRSVIDEHTVRELFFRHPVDGLLSVQITAVAAPFVDDKAQWGGTTQKIKHRGDGFFGAISGKKYQGHIAATAVRIVISNRKGIPVYNWSGGIEVMMQRNGKKFEQLPMDQLWQNEKRVKKAVRYALKPI